ncbi:MAG: hypothetical protein FJX67_10910 [Alphaproteobacteria bacterium]|nr:hypothetical protein [Alphaproteobacteria bacterium]
MALKRITQETLVNTSTTGVQTLPEIASLSNGNFLIVWRGLDTSITGISGRFYGPNFLPLAGAEVLINTFQTNAQGSPSVTGLPGNQCVVTWESFAQDGSNWGVYARRYNAAGTALSPEFQANLTTADNQQFPAVIPV